MLEPPYEVHVLAESVAPTKQEADAPPSPNLNTRIHTQQTYFALQFTFDPTPVPPDHLGEPGTPLCIKRFQFRTRPVTLLRTDSC